MNYKPLIVIDDDNEEVRKIFKLKAVKANVEIVGFATWDKTKEYLEGNTSVDAIVLDAKGQLNADKDPSESHLLASLGFVKNRLLPYAIYTAFSEQLPMLEQELEDGRVFTKGRHKEEDIFDFLKEEIAKTPHGKLKRKYGLAFRSFHDGIIDHQYEHILVELLTCLEEADYKKKNLNVVRDLLESIFQTAIENYDFIPATFQNSNGMPVLEWCTRFIEGKETNDGVGVSHKIKLIIPAYIQYNIRYIKNISSAYSHLNENAIVKNAFISSAYSIIEVLEWLPVFIEENFE